MAINLKDLYDIYNGDPQQLTPIKGNTPFEYYTNDPEFTADSLSILRFVAQRLGVTGPAFNFATQQYAASAASISITDLTVYAAFEEAVTTYGNMVYQYKIRDNYISMEGSDTLPFFNNTITYVNSLDVGSPVTWSAARTATWEEIGFEPAYSQSIVDGEIFVISSSISDYIAPDYNFLKSFNLADNYINSESGISYNLSQFVYNQFNKVAAPTLFTPYYDINSGSFDFNNIISSAIINESSSFSITGSNSIAINFIITGSPLPEDTLSTFFIAFDSSSNEIASNIASKITNVSLNTFGTFITANTGSIFTTIEFTSSLSEYDISNFKINNTSIFSNVTSGSTPSVAEGQSHIYFFTTNPVIAGGSSFFQSGSIQESIPTVYLQSNLKPALNNKLLSNNLTTITTRIAQDYAAEAGVGGNYEINTGMIKMTQGVQKYDLNAWAAASASLSEGDTIEVRRVFYESPPAIVRYFDPYAGTGTGIQSLLETFGFGQMSPGINFLLMPIFFDVMKIQAIEFNDQIRKSDYSFDLRNNQLKIFPIPTRDQLLMFEYVKISQKNQIVRDNRPNVITDIMNVPYRNPLYSNINTVGRTWIFKYTLSICREIEAHIRIQYANLNVQGIGPLQGNELINDARKEKEDLVIELKEMLNEVSRRSQLERKQQEAEFTRDTLTNAPTNIYIM
jgi:hypothetical protein